MRFRTLKHYFIEAFISMKRNGWMSFASVGTVAISLVIFGFSLLLIMNTNHIAGILESNVEITIFLDERLSANDVENVGQEIKALKGVTKLEYISKDDALEILKKQFKDRQGVFDTLGEMNPLPDAYKIKVANPDLVTSTANKISGIYGVTKVRYGQGIVEKLFVITKWIRLAGLVVMISLGMGAIFLVATTIRLTVFARRREIGIMKFLGATDWFIRWPFLLEGLFLGLFGALVAVLVILVAYLSLVDSLKTSLSFIPLLSQNDLMVNLSFSLIGVGALIGVVGSFISVHKHLKV